MDWCDLPLWCGDDVAVEMLIAGWAMCHFVWNFSRHKLQPERSKPRLHTGLDRGSLQQKQNPNTPQQHKQTEKRADDEEICDLSTWQYLQQQIKEKETFLLQSIIKKISRFDNAPGKSHITHWVISDFWIQSVTPTVASALAQVGLLGFYIFLSIFI